jgi:hypothetical protein
VTLVQEESHDVANLRLPESDAARFQTFTEAQHDFHEKILFVIWASDWLKRDAHLIRLVTCSHYLGQFP